MQNIKKTRRERLNERGIGLFIVAASLVVLLGVGALAVDLGALYVARSEAQRAADSSALAAASKLIESGFTSGFVTQATAENLARQEAITIGGQNTVGGDPAVIAAGDVVFDFSVPENPLVTVTVRRTAATNNPMPTFFAKVFGISEVDVTAAATAEAFNPSGGGAAIGTDCVKPWILPNCDPVNAGPSSATCSGGETTFVDNVTGAIINPGTVIGTPLLLKAGNPSEASAPSQFYPIQIPTVSENAICPDFTWH